MTYTNILGGIHPTDGHSAETFSKKWRFLGGVTMNAHPNLCGCCLEIWNQSNLVKIPLGKHTLQLCPDCYKEYRKTMSSISELQSIATSEKEAS